MYAARFDCGYAIFQRICHSHCPCHPAFSLSILLLRFLIWSGSFTVPQTNSPRLSSSCDAICIIFNTAPVFVHVIHNNDTSTMWLFWICQWHSLISTECALTHTNHITLGTLFLCDLIIFHRCWLHYVRCTPFLSVRNMVVQYIIFTVKYSVWAAKATIIVCR